MLNSRVPDSDLSSLCGLIDWILADLEGKDFRPLRVKDKRLRKA